MSLSMLSPHVVATDMAQRRNSGMFATPDPFRPDQSPLGAIQTDPGSHVRRPSPSPEGSFGSWGGVAVSSALADFPTISFVLTDPQL
jgi:hypothetical protein